MTEFEIPSEPIYKGGARCPYRRPILGEDPDFWIRQQWYFEKAYFDSPYNWGMPFRERFFKGSGFDQYQFYKGGDKCPFPAGSKAFRWWDMEHDHYLWSKDNPDVPRFVIHFRNWVIDCAAGSVGHDLEINGNPWLDDYLQDAPVVGSYNFKI